MSVRHNLPDNVSPSGDVCHPIFIPNDPQYRQLVLGALQQLVEPEYYEEFDYDLSTVEDVIDIWNSRTITPFVQSLAVGDNCGSGGSAMVQFLEYNRDTSNQAIQASTDTYIEWNAGDITPPATLTEIPLPANKICDISGTFFARDNGVDIITVYSHLIVNGVIVASQRTSGTVFHEHNLSAQVRVGASDTVKLLVRLSQDGIIDVGQFLPRLSIVANDEG